MKKKPRPKPKRPKLQNPPKAKKGATVSGAWRFHGDGPEIKFRASPEKASFTFTGKQSVMSRKAWTAFFRFMLAVFQNVRPATLNDQLKEFVRERRKRRVRRWRRRHPRIIRPQKVHQLDPEPAPPEIDVGPSPELLAAAQEKLKEKK